MRDGKRSKRDVGALQALIMRMVSDLHAIPRESLAVCEPQVRTLYMETVMALSWLKQQREAEAAGVK